MQNGRANGVPKLEVVGPERIHHLEPRANEQATCALWCPSTGYVDPFDVAIACAENATANDVIFLREAPRAGHRHAFGQCPLTRRVALPVRPARTLCHSHTQRNRALSHPRQRRGQRGRLDLAHGGSRGIQARVAPGQHRRARQANRAPSCHSTPCPHPSRRGVIVTGTVHGNTVITATAALREPGDRDTYAADVETLLDGARKLVPDLDTRRVVRTFAGGRGHRGAERFHDRPLRRPSRYVPCRGHSIPGVASAPAIAERMDRVLHDTGLDLRNARIGTPCAAHPRILTGRAPSTKRSLSSTTPHGGASFAGAETVPEAEIVQAIRRSPGAVSVEGVKRRCRAGMGRCQSGFCQSRVVHILARELGCEPSAVPLEDRGSWIVDGTLKEGR